MTLKDDITQAVTKVVMTPFDVRDGDVVPTTESVKLADGAVKLDAVYLYADMADSTGLARDFPRATAAKVVRAFLTGACGVINAKGGEIRSFDGDRVMAIFVGSAKNTSAVDCALKIHHVVAKIVRPRLETSFPSLVEKGYELRHCVGIASGEALIVRGGVRGSNDLVSIGRPPNVAAKLSEIRCGSYATYIAKQVYDTMHDSAKFGGDPRQNMWEKRTLEIAGQTGTYYRSSFWRTP